MKNTTFILQALITLLMVTSCNTKKDIKVIDLQSEFAYNDTIPPSVHAATLEEISNNQLIAAWFGGSYEGAKDVGIYSAFYTQNKWQKPTQLVQPPVINNDTLACWNPVLFKSKSNKLYLFYKAGKNPREWFGALITSDDEGQSWTEPMYLPDGFLGPIKNKPVELIDGQIICGSSTESIEGNIWRAHVEIFNEADNTWKMVEIPNTKHLEVIQPTFIPHPDNKLEMLCRSKHNKVVTAWSDYSGTNWSELDTINVVNSNSGIDAIAIDDDLFLMVNNPLKQGPDWFYGRNILDVEYSTDGVNWNKLFDLENEEKGQFSYPAIIQTSDKTIHVLYTYNREGIKHTQFRIE
ncbi:sialidase family protein [Carboxylicivirga linearis]|uniref:Exo-alpha-sialidase n=1 Tax=Carboxylicivirga linearis TaxID=1628157 RepID=A0ABS5K196_9BACT|nr:sialidase family protein [Carboxylicivirga linearis]MBS2100909.1 exo-alpha-sialidase [Carboxylicivirga linearis]